MASGTIGQIHRATLGPRGARNTGCPVGACPPTKPALGTIAFVAAQLCTTRACSKASNRGRIQEAPGARTGNIAAVMSQ